jgi:MFS transporter, DHA2 family, multidrug resistance protein
MSDAAQPRAWRPLMGLRGFGFPWAIAFATGLDYFDNSIFSFFTSYIAGGINASADELVWSTSAYAVTSVLGILQQQWWIERLGNRRYIALCMLLYAAGALAASFAESSLELAIARGVQGFFIGPMMSTCRILIQNRFGAKERPKATRAFLTMILLGSSLAPLAGGYLVADFGWRALFLCTAVVALAIGAFVLFAVPPGGRVNPEARSDAHIWPYIVFALAQGALQVTMQQVRFELFTTSPLLIALTLAGLAGLGWFAWHQWHEPRPLLRLHALKEKSFRTGVMLYIAYYYVSNALSYLFSRFLEGGLDYPVLNAGRLTGLTSLVSIAGAYAYFRYAPRIPRKKWLIAPGFLLAAFVSAWMLNMPPDVSMPWLVLPLVLRGMLLLFVALPVANITFRVFAVDEFNHGYRFKNIVKQLAVSFSTANLIILDQHRRALHQTRLVENVNPFNPVFQNIYAQAVANFEAMGRGVAEARALALAQIGRAVTQQASFMSSLDGFSFVMAIALCAFVFAVWQEQID